MKVGRAQDGMRKGKDWDSDQDGEGEQEGMGEGDEGEKGSRELREERMW